MIKRQMNKYCQVQISPKIPLKFQSVVVEQNDNLKIPHQTLIEISFVKIHDVTVNEMQMLPIPVTTNTNGRQIQRDQVCGILEILFND